MGEKGDNASIVSLEVRGSGSRPPVERLASVAQDRSSTVTGGVAEHTGMDARCWADRAVSVWKLASECVRFHGGEKCPAAPLEASSKTSSSAGGSGRRCCRFEEKGKVWSDPVFPPVPVGVGTGEMIVNKTQYIELK